MDEIVSPQQIREVLSDWFRARGPSAIRLTENIKPNNEPYADYIIVYEAVFEPDSLEKARIQIAVADDGRIAIGSETKNRIAERLGIRGGQ